MNIRQVLGRRQLTVSVAVLAALAYIPALSAAPGRMPADSKLYVYLDPARFLRDTVTTFDPRLYAGWVPHQHISYLWPTGPWFWLFDRIGVPDWIAHRLWIGTLLIAAGLGVRWLGRVLGLGPTAALTAAIVYQLSPYVLPYISRTSVLLLPFAGLGWIVALTIMATQRGRWRFAAGVALVVFTVGAVNATALAMIIPAPLLWLVHATWQRTITWRRAVATAAKVALLSIVVSLWWMAMLIIQGRRGADVLAYSESLESVSFTSTSTEVMRGLGYWLFYIRDAFGATTTASIDYLASVKIIAFGIVLLASCLVGLVVTKWEHRRFAALLIGVGAVLAVGVHPIGSPSPLMTLLLGDGQGGLGLALRSSTRAVPVLVLGLALSAGALVAACQPIIIGAPALIRRRAISVGTALAVVIAVLAIVNLPSLRNGGFVDPQLERDQDPPQAWSDAAARLDELPAGYRVLQLPGAEFGAFRWGYTVDQPLPALTNRAVLTRDLLPLGSASAMDLVFALDDRFQDGVADVGAVAPIARLLGVDTVWVAGDVAFDRFRLARPELVDDLLTGEAAAAAGLAPAERFGTPRSMVPDISVVDETAVSNARVGAPIAPVSLVGVDDPVPTIRAKNRVVVVSGSGDGLVDAAAAGVIDGTELILYSASLDQAALNDALSSAERLVVTDSNRDRAHHWRSSQDVTGYTESGGPDPGVLRFEAGDARLPVFASTDAATQTVSIQKGPVTATATAYGEPFAYLPESRPVMAIDGDIATSWTVGSRATAIGEQLRLAVSEPIDHITLRQPDTTPGARTISSVEIKIGDRAPVRVDLDERSLDGDGQRVEIDPTTGATDVAITITATSGPDVGVPANGVGFAEVDVGLPPTKEIIRVPQDGLDGLGTTTPLSMVLTRLRTDPTDRWRNDPEPTLVRQFTLPRDLSASATTAITLRADQRMADSTLATLLDEPVTASAHLTGVPAARGAAAFDGDPATSWITPFGAPVGQSLTATLEGTATSMQLTQPQGSFSPITSIKVTDQAGSFDIALDPASPTIELPRSIDLANVTLEITSIDEQTTKDRRFGEPVTLPAAIAEITFDGQSPGVQPRRQVTADCRSDLLRVDGQGLGVSFTASADSILTGAAIEATPCSPVVLDKGRHLIESSPSAATGFNVDRVSIEESVPSAAPTTADPKVEVVSSSRTKRVVEVPACPAGCWVVLGEGYNAGWSARTSSGDLGAPLLVDGNANGWRLPPSTTPTTVTMVWAAQRTLNVALVASLIGVLATLAIVIFDRRRANDVVVTMPPPRLALAWRRRGIEWERRRAVATLGVAMVASALLIDWKWALAALGLWLIAYLARSARVFCALGLSIVLFAQLTVVIVVLRDRPAPGADFPVRFEWLHPWTLLGVVIAVCATLFDRDSVTPAARRAR